MSTFPDCIQCGHAHRHRADLLACDAIFGMLRAYPAGVRTPVCMCELCGATEPLDELLEHFYYSHRHEHVRSGQLVRFVLDAPDVSEYGREDA